MFVCLHPMIQFQLLNYVNLLIDVPGKPPIDDLRTVAHIKTLVHQIYSAMNIEQHQVLEKLLFCLTVILAACDSSICLKVLFLCSYQCKRVHSIKRLAIYQLEMDKGEFTAINLPSSTQFKFMNSKVFHFLPPTQTNFLLSEDST